MLVFEMARENFTRQGPARVRRGFPRLPVLAQNISGSHRRVLDVRAGLALERERFLEVEGDNRIASESKHEVAERPNRDSLRYRAAFGLGEVLVPAAHFIERIVDQKIEKVVRLDA